MSSLVNSFFDKISNKSEEFSKRDILSGFQVFLIALPLSLGISIASGFPLAAGLVSAVIGGIVVSRIGGTYVNINGPAAGLIVVVLSGVETLGHGNNLVGYKLTLAAIVISGVAQCLLAIVKFPKFAALFPVSVIHGMLASIGIIIISKQLPLLLGTNIKVSDFFVMIEKLPLIINQTNPQIALVGGLSLLILSFFYIFRSVSPISKVPAPLVVTAFGLVSTFAFNLRQDHSYQFLNQSFQVGKKLLVSLPTDTLAALGFPDFSAVTTLSFWLVVFSITFVASLETLISAQAVEKIDPLKRSSDLSRHLFGIGAGTILSGLCGGLPMIAEIVRSTANVQAGARSSWSNFFHGFFLLTAVALIPSVISLIPLTCLAALLIFTGFRLASPMEFQKVRSVGMDQFLIFLTTIIITIKIDLLVGCFAGIFLKFVLHLFRGIRFRELFKSHFTLHENIAQGKLMIKLLSPLIFSNMFQLLKILEKHRHSQSIIIDLTESKFIDHSAIEKLKLYERKSIENGTFVQIIESNDHMPYSNHELSARKLKNVRV